MPFNDQTDYRIRTQTERNERNLGGPTPYPKKRSYLGRRKQHYERKPTKQPPATPTDKGKHFSQRWTEIKFPTEGKSRISSVRLRLYGACDAVQRE